MTDGKPTFGHTRRGLAVHAHRFDQLPGYTRFQRFNRRAAIAITNSVGTMTCAYIFGIIALVSLPAAITSHSVIIIVGWVAQTFLQLVLLSIIIVGQKVGGEAADARAAKTFEDVEAILDRLDAHTQGGIKEILDAVTSLQLRQGYGGSAGGSAGGAGGTVTSNDASRGGGGGGRGY